MAGTRWNAFRLSYRQTNDNIMLLFYSILFFNIIIHSQISAVHLNLKLLNCTRTVFSFEYPLSETILGG